MKSRRALKRVAARLYELDPAVENTFLVTRNRLVAANVSDVDSGSFDRVIDATERMLENTE